MKTYNRIYASIDLDAIGQNLQEIHKRLKDGTKVISVIKADGYGHGAVEIARETQEFPYLWGFAIATIEEALVLRRHGIYKPILALGYCFEEDFNSMIENDIRSCIFSYETAALLSETAKRIGKTAKIHIKLDTGMSRIGFQVTEESADEIAKIAGLSGIEIEGAFTHFAKSDEVDKTATYQQLEQYRKMIALLLDRGVTIPIKHTSNSAGIVEVEEAHMDAVRAGIIQYGLWPSKEVDKNKIHLHPVMELKTKIIQIKVLESGRSISYGGTCTLTEDKRVATIPIGYGDGYPRSLSNKGFVLIHGKRAPILGRICMDQFMVDVTDIKEAKVLDTVTLLGHDHGAFLSMEELGEISGRFNYEFACDIGKRVPRVYLKNKKIIYTKDYFEE